MAHKLDQRNIDAVIKFDDGELKIKLSPREIYTMLENASKEDRLAVVEMLADDGGDVWDLMRKLVNDNK